MLVRRPGVTWDTITVQRIVITLLMITVAVLIVSLVQNSRATDRARQECEARNRQHALQSAYSGGAYTWPVEDCH